MSMPPNSGEYYITNSLVSIKDFSYLNSFTIQGQKTTLGMFEYDVISESDQLSHVHI